jgi:hypothetical protein
MDLNNLGPTELSMRLVFETQQPLTPETPRILNRAFSADPIVLPVGSGWVHAVFPIALAAFIADRGTAEGALSIDPALHEGAVLSTRAGRKSYCAALNVITDRPLRISRRASTFIGRAVSRPNAAMVSTRSIRFP